MGELGEIAEGAHRDLGRLAGELGLDGLFLLGDYAELSAGAAREAGLNGERIVIGTNHESLARALSERLREGDRVLIKGSRAARMERVIELLEEASH